MAGKMKAHSSVHKKGLFSLLTQLTKKAKI